MADDKGRKRRAKPQSGTPKSRGPTWPVSADGRPKQFSVPPEVVEHILLGPRDDRRVLQDSPLLGDVWAAYALDPGIAQDVLITPHKNATAVSVARTIAGALKVPVESAPPGRPPTKAKVAYLQGLVGARLYFDQVLRILVPRTQWWREPKVAERIEGVDAGDNQGTIKKLLQQGPKRSNALRERTLDNATSLQRYIALAGLIYWICKLERPVGWDEPLEPLTFEQALERYRDYADEILSGMFALYEVVKAGENARQQNDGVDTRSEPAEERPTCIFQVSLNRSAVPALDRSVPAVKADAARSLFNVQCKNIVWAVLDSGIQNNHDAFMTSGEKPTSRVRKIFDFTNIREIVSSETGDVDAQTREKLIRTSGLAEAEVDVNLEKIAEDFEKERPINWATVERLITVKRPDPNDKSEKLPSSHGTHVAGIIGADQKDGKYAGGMCPDIGLYDFRVLGASLEETEFAVIAAMQYIRYVNERHNYIMIHGANLSLSIPHNVRNFACGRTPICNECERLVESGVVVVAAAGNRGFQKFETKDGPFENYAAFSITDPGNAEGVITVGSTHGNWPHTYGISFFSSRGPTGDGRAKPDLVAPGERILSTVPNDDWAPESGTSMAAPMVSGAAAMLLARYEELIGQPRRVKRILCESATDLGRERSFQGHGMLDVLRALQSI
ncbi:MULTISPECIES: S8 family peptidase [unclassified Bradyrhizobium]|uniref:S8 family peptidase n=1 Tax=unclassified Bradyrhizobium TaxID=2631580 RepID=UPI001CD7A2C8|nr:MULTISPECIES: S8 family peptidase [unclassified Bradyrhizobium]MCA1435429.1 S8 family peptidase [Bradyrhizobium sp. BRP20]MCA1477899.1 S8 family peptidase [Bradyrhizobium sp. NBAIM08]